MPHNPSSGLHTRRVWILSLVFCCTIWVLAKLLLYCWRWWRKIGVFKAPRMKKKVGEETAQIRHPQQSTRSWVRGMVWGTSLPRKCRYCIYAFSSYVSSWRWGRCTYSRHISFPYGASYSTLRSLYIYIYIPFVPFLFFFFSFSFPFLSQTIVFSHFEKIIHLFCIFLSHAFVKIFFGYRSIFPR